MAPPFEQLRLKRASTIQNMFGSRESFKSEAASVRAAASARIRDVTSRSSGSMRNLLNKVHRNHEPRSEMMTRPSSLTSVDRSPPTITNLAKAFADALTFQQLSNFLAWMLYYDATELPESPESWYSLIDPMEMRGWVALGDYLSTHGRSSYGLDLIVLESICDRNNLNRKTVHMMLMQFADPRKMVHSQIALAVQEAENNGSTSLQSLEHVHAKLHELYKLTIRIKPMDGSIFQAGHAMTEMRIRGYLHLVVGPRVKSIRSGTPLATAATSEHLPKDVLEGIKLNYYFEAMQQQRVVPLARYGALSPSISKSMGSPDPGHTDIQAEQVRKQALELATANQTLKSQMANLQRRNQELLASNESMARKSTAMGSLQPTAHFRMTSSDEHCVAASSPTSSTGQNATPVPQTLPRTPLPDTAAHARELHQSDDQATKYGTIFDSLDVTTPPALRLVNPGSSNAATAPGPARNVGPSSPVTGAGRRWGSKFTHGLNNVFGAL